MDAPHAESIYEGEKPYINCPLNLNKIRTADRENDEDGNRYYIY